MKKTVKVIEHYSVVQFEKKVNEFISQYDNQESKYSISIGNISVIKQHGTGYFYTVIIEVTQLF